MAKLNPRQLKFVENLLKGQTYGGAYREAGYKVKSEGQARANGSRLASNPDVAAYWAEERDKYMELSRSRLVLLSLDALPVLQELMMNGKSESIKLAAAKDILDRSGIKAPTQLEVGTDGNVIINFVGIDDNTFPDAETS